MAKMFIKSEEAQQELGLDEEGLKQLVREGRLREFRDGATVMYKKEQIDQLSGEGGAGGGDQVDLADQSMDDSIGLADSAGASGSIGLADTGGSGDSIGLSDTGSADDIGISDTGAGIGLSPDDTAADMGLSGSLGGVPSPGADASAGSSGITVLDDTGGADPMAQTAISSGVSDQVNLEPTGSGSGLLDLTREADDTSLGADVLDDLGPGGTGFGSSAVASPMGSAMGSAMGSGMGASGIGGTAIGAAAITPAGSAAAAPVAPAYATAAPDAVSSGLGAASLAAALVCLLGLVGVAGMASGVLPGVLEAITSVEAAPSFVIVAAIGVVLAILFFVVGAVVGKR